jgi:hypothetical protein
MRHQLPNLLAILALPAGLAGYFGGAWLLRTLAPGLADTVLMVFLPLFVAGLVMIPFAAPWFDRRAKADLAEVRARRMAAEAADAASRDGGGAARDGTGASRQPRPRRRRGR